MNRVPYSGRRDIPAVAIGILLCVLIGGWGCSNGGSESKWGGKPLTSDEYARVVSSETPRHAYLAWKAQQQSRPLAEVENADASLSTLRNPYSRSDGDAVAMGRSMYTVHCASCHGADADGTGPAAAADTERMSFHNSHKRAYITLFGHAPDNWYPSIAQGPAGNEKITDPSMKMPAFERTLAREQIWLLVTYLEQETTHPGQFSSPR